MAGATDSPTTSCMIKLLLGPGPSLVDPRVLKAMATPLLGHLDPCFLEIMDRTQIMLRYVYQTENQITIPVSGTGSATMEAAVANMVEPGTKVLVCINGYFGNRLADMAGRYGADLKTIQRPWGEVFTPEEIESVLKGHRAQVVAIVHAETSTGAMQPLEEIVKVVRENGAILIIDSRILQTKVHSIEIVKQAAQFFFPEVVRRHEWHLGKIGGKLIEVFADADRRRRLYQLFDFRIQLLNQ